MNDSVIMWFCNLLISLIFFDELIDFGKIDEVIGRLIKIKVFGEKVDILCVFECIILIIGSELAINIFEG